MNSIDDDKVRVRHVDAGALENLLDSGLQPALAASLAARGVFRVEDIAVDLERLYPYQALKGAEDMAAMLLDCIASKQKIAVVADYDCDGNGAASVAVRGLRMFGADVVYVVPDRKIHGYGLTPTVVDLAISEHNPDVLVTVDNGIASFDGIDAAHAAGRRVFVTDHHLPGDFLPDADVIVNPCQPGCDFPSKNLAGVGVIYYVLLATRAEAYQRGLIASQESVPIESLLDIVALSTVADVVKLDSNNRILVESGLRLIRSGNAKPLIRELLSVCGIPEDEVTTQTLGFTLGPRINAAGRIRNMAIAIDGMISDDILETAEIARQLHTINAERQSMEAEMREVAEIDLQAINVDNVYGATFFDESYHEGIVGLLASRIKDATNRPTIVFASSGADSLKGSGRSVDGLHLRDALDVVTKQYPHLIEKFGGHSAAAGLTVSRANYEEFASAFDSVVKRMIPPESLTRTVVTDGSFAGELTLEAAELFGMFPWGQGFPEPSFVDEFEVVSQRVVGAKHLKLLLRKDGRDADAIFFGRTVPLPGASRLLYRLGVNSFRGARTLQLVVSDVILASTLTPRADETAFTPTLARSAGSAVPANVRPRGAW